MREAAYLLIARGCAARHGSFTSRHGSIERGRAAIARGCAARHGSIAKPFPKAADHTKKATLKGIFCFQILLQGKPKIVRPAKIL